MSRHPSDVGLGCAFPDTRQGEPFATIGVAISAFRPRESRNGGLFRAGLEKFIPTIYRIDTTKTGTGHTANNQFKLPLGSSGRYNFSVNWGDGSPAERITAWNQAETTHTYAAPGVYDITITGKCFGWRFANAGDRLKMIAVLQWGTSVRFTLYAAFQGCENLVWSPAAADNNIWKGVLGTVALNLSYCRFASVPLLLAWDWSRVNEISSLFRDNPNFNQDISSWDTSHFTNFTAMLLNCTAFNQPVGAWNMSQAVYAPLIFTGCSVFNQDLSAWDLSNAVDVGALFNSCTVFDNAGSDGIGGWNLSKNTSLAEMFRRAYAFNRNIGAWDVSKVTTFERMFQGEAIASPVMIFNRDISGWNTSEAVSMSLMFSDTAAFNQNIGSWNVEKVTNFSQMFRSAGTNPPKVFKQSLANWWPKSATNMSQMFEGQDINSPASPANLATFIEAFDNAAWAKTNMASVVANATADPTGRSVADKLRPNTTNTADHRVSQSAATVNGTSYSFDIYLKESEYRHVRVRLMNGVTVLASVDVDLNSGLVLGGSGTVTWAGGSWWKITVTANAASATTSYDVQVFNAATFASYAGNNSNGVFIWGARFYPTADVGNTANYEALLVGWTGWSGGAPGAKGLALKTSVAFHAGNARIRLGSDAAAARAWLSTPVGSGGKGWTITDGGVVAVP